MNTASPIPKPEMVSIPKQDLDALMAELEALRKLQQEVMQRLVVGRFPKRIVDGWRRADNPACENRETFVVTAASREKAVKKAQCKFYR